jgi:hypothetical protein
LKYCVEVVGSLRLYEGHDNDHHWTTTKLDGGESTAILDLERWLADEPVEDEEMARNIIR